MKTKDYYELLDDLWDLRLNTLENKRVVAYGGDDVCCSVFLDLPKPEDVTIYALELIKARFVKEPDTTSSVTPESIHYNVFKQHSDEELLGPTGTGSLAFWCGQYEDKGVSNE